MTGATAALFLGGVATGLAIAAMAIIAIGVWLWNKARE